MVHLEGLEDSILAMPPRKQAMQHPTVSSLFQANHSRHQHSQQAMACLQHSSKLTYSLSNRPCRKIPQPRPCPRMRKCRVNMSASCLRLVCPDDMLDVLQLSTECLGSRWQVCSICVCLESVNAGCSSWITTSWLSQCQFNDAVL